MQLGDVYEILWRDARSEDNWHAADAEVPLVVNQSYGELVEVHDRYLSLAATRTLGTGIVCHRMVIPRESVVTVTRLGKAGQ